MGVFAGPEVVNDRLIIAIDASNTKSYPGSENTWNNLISSLSFNLKNCTFSQNDISGNGSTSSIQSNSDLNLSSYSDFTIVLGFKSSDYITNSIILDYGSSYYFYYFPSYPFTNSNQTINSTTTSISSFSPVYNASLNQTDTVTTIESTVSGISSFSPVYNASLNQTDTVTTIESTSTQIVGFNALKNNSSIIRVNNNSIISDTIVDNNSYSISTNTVDSNYNLISVVYSNLNTQNATVSFYQSKDLVNSIGIGSFSFPNTKMFLLSLGGANKLSNSSLKFLSIYNKSLSSEEILGINASFKSRT